MLQRELRSQQRRPSVYGAGLFFIGYFIFEVPSNLILHRVGARIWIARIMILWGMVAMAFCSCSGTPMFYVMRFLLGAAEAGFFPGVILYLTYWFPAKERARTIALFATGGVMAGVVGSPISGAILGLNGVGGLAGWQWLFVVEGLPAVVLGLAALVVLTDRPEQAELAGSRGPGLAQSPRWPASARSARGTAASWRSLLDRRNCCCCASSIS